MIAPTTSKRIPLDSTVGVLRRIDLPKCVLQAEKWLKKHEFSLYRKISGYRNCGHVNELEMSVIETYAAFCRSSIEKVKPFILKFVNCESVSPIPEDQKVKLTLSDGEIESERYNTIHHKYVS